MALPRPETENVLQLLQLFKTRRELCRNLLTFSRSQRELIESDDYTELLVLLGRKQRILGQLDDLKKNHPQLLNRWRGQRETIDPVLREDCEHVLAETEAILAELLNEENNSTKQLTHRRDATQKQLQAITKGTQIHEAYRDSLAPTTHRHLNVNQ